jgi:GNAT superfamily N-acetyltransferase
MARSTYESIAPAWNMVAPKLTEPANTHMVVETEPNLEDLLLLEDRIYEFNVQVTGVADGKLFACFLREADGVAVGGVSGWTWGGTCYVRHLFVPTHLRNQGCGIALMRAVEVEAKARGCAQIVLETLDFQAPEFYLRLGSKIAGRVVGYPHRHERLTMVVKQLAPWGRRLVRWPLGSGSARRAHDCPRVPGWRWPAVRLTLGRRFTH